MPITFDPVEQFKFCDQNFSIATQLHGPIYLISFLKILNFYITDILSLSSYSTIFYLPNHISFLFSIWYNKYLINYHFEWEINKFTNFLLKTRNYQNESFHNYRIKKLSLFYHFLSSSIHKVKKLPTYRLSNLEKISCIVKQQINFDHDRRTLTSCNKTDK